MNGTEKNTRAKIALAMVVLGLVLAGVAVYELWLTEDVLDPPEEITLQDLAQRGPKAPIRVRLTGFGVGSGRYSEGKRTTGSSWRESWLPLYVKDGNPQEIVAILIVKAPTDQEADLRRIYEQAGRSGSVEGQLGKLPPDRQEELRKHLQLDATANPILIRGSDRPVDTTHLKVLLGLGPVLVVLGGLWLLLILHYRPPPEQPAFFPAGPPR
jgi:hypothetical protein